MNRLSKIGPIAATKECCTTRSRNAGAETCRVLGSNTMNRVYGAGEYRPDSSRCFNFPSSYSKEKSNEQTFCCSFFPCRARVYARSSGSISQICSNIYKDIPICPSMPPHFFSRHLFPAPSASVFPSPSVFASPVCLPFPVRLCEALRSNPVPDPVFVPWFAAVADSLTKTEAVWIASVADSLAKTERGSASSEGMARNNRLPHQIIIQVFPFWIHRLDQCQFLLSRTGLYLLLTNDYGFH